MSFAKIKIVVVSIIIVILTSLFVLKIIGMICPFELVAYSEDTPISIVRNNDLLCTGISQIVSDDNDIYILYGTYGVVQAYDKDGTYKYTVSIYNHTNGRTKIATNNNALYICDKINNIYIFENGEITQYIDRHESYSTRNRLSFGEWDPAYSVRAGSVWNTNNSGVSQCVIKRPIWLTIYQNDLITMLMLLLVALCGAILLFPKSSIEGK